MKTKVNRFTDEFKYKVVSNIFTYVRTSCDVSLRLPFIIFLLMFGRVATHPYMCH